MPKAGDVSDILSRITGPASGYVKAFDAYKAGAESVDEVLTRRQIVLVRTAIAAAIPSEAMLRVCMAEARGVISQEEIELAVCAAASLRAGAAVSYGRLAFKYFDDSPASTADSTEASSIRKDRELMTQLRKAAPADFERMTRLLGEMHRDGLKVSKLDYELIAIGCATITQCAYCLEHHVGAARKLGMETSQIGHVVHLAVSARIEASFLAAGSVL